MDSDPAGHYNYGPREKVDSSIHGRIANIPAKLNGYGEAWNGDECTLWCEGVVRQAAVFGEYLELHRRVEATVGSNEVVVSDHVVNAGFCRTPHMYLYHLNFGYPLLDEGSTFVAPIRHTIWAAHADALKAQGVGYRTMPEPQRSFHEQVFEHAIASDDDGKVPVALVNRGYNDGEGLGILIEWSEEEFPCLIQWQHLQDGAYAMGIEPSTNHVFGKPFARERDELCWLEHGDYRSYTTTFRVLNDVSAIDEAESRIRSICEQPSADYPAITDKWDD
jgi:hypothetical protein